MAEKVFKVGEAIEIVYQAPNAESGLDSIRADIYDETKALDAVDQPLTEVGNSGTYRRSFTPDEQGEWEVVIYKFIDSDTRDGQVVKRYSVGGHNVHSVGEGVAALPDADAINAEVDTALAEYDASTKAELDTAQGVIQGDIADLNDIDAASVNAQVDSALVDYDGPTKDELDAAHSTTNAKIDNLDTKVSSLDTPPMVS